MKNVFAVRARHNPQVRASAADCLRCVSLIRSWNWYASRSASLRRRTSSRLSSCHRSRHPQLYTRRRSQEFRSSDPKHTGVFFHHYANTKTRQSGRRGIPTASDRTCEDLKVSLVVAESRSTGSLRRFPYAGFYCMCRPNYYSTSALRSSQPVTQRVDHHYPPASHVDYCRSIYAHAGGFQPTRLVGG